MKKEKFPIPDRLNLLLAWLLFFSLVGIAWLAGKSAQWWEIAAIAMLYGIVMNSAYAMIHEAEHNLAHSNPKINISIGVTLAFFFPAPFHLLRQGHLGHHMRNRSDDEAFDFYFEGEHPLWKFMQLYGTLTGLFWVTIFLSNFVAAVNPALLHPKYGKFDRPTEALLASLNPRYLRVIRLEALFAIALQVALVYWWKIPLLNYFAMLFGFGFIWSAMQYAHHFGTVRDVRWGARNLRTLALVDLVWLNHNYHLNHHLRPTVPWIYLPQLYQGERFKRGSLSLAYLRMWSGPRFTSDRIENRYAGKIIK